MCNFYLNSQGSLTCCHFSTSQDGGHATWLQACSSGGLVSTQSLLDTSSVRFPATDLTQDTPRVCSPTPHDTEHWFHTLTSHLKKTHSLCEFTNHVWWKIIQINMHNKTKNMHYKSKQGAFSFHPSFNTKSQKHSLPQQAKRLWFSRILLYGFCTVMRNMKLLSLNLAFAFRDNQDRTDPYEADHTA